LLSDDHLLGRVNAVNLEHVLGDIQTDRGNLHVDGSPHVIRFDEPPYGTAMPGAGASTTRAEVAHILQSHSQGNTRKPQATNVPREGD
jgi:hypothetical protein